MDDASRLARLAAAAAARVEDGMRLGIGTGSTADAFIRALGERVAGGLRVVGVPTSTQSEALCRAVGIPLATLEDMPHLDLGVDGADEIDPNLDLVKGRGGALLYEKIVALSCDAYLIVAASQKLVDQLGTRLPLPVEVVPYGWESTATRVSALGIEPTLRCDKSGQPVRSDGGHFLLDCETGPIASPAGLARDLKGLTGVVDHGLFIGIATEALVVEPDGTIRSIGKSA